MSFKKQLIGVGKLVLIDICYWICLLILLTVITKLQFPKPANGNDAITALVLMWYAACFFLEACAIFCGFGWIVTTVLNFWLADKWHLKGVFVLISLIALIGCNFLLKMLADYVFVTYLR